jgi:uncharacterized low-complexity protein
VAASNHWRQTDEDGVPVFEKTRMRSEKMSKKSMKPVAAAIGAAFAGSMMLTGAANAGSNPFGLTELNGGYAQIAGSHMEGKCGGAKPAGEGKCGSGKCGGSAAAEKAAEGKCGAGKCGGAAATEKAAEGKCGAGKCGGAAATEKAAEGKCGAGKCGGAAATEKAAEGKCGAGKCGGAKQ